MKFKFGDKVEAIDNYYAVTSLENKWIGEVIEIYYGSIRVKTITCLEDFGTVVKLKEYDVNPEHFKLVEDKKEPKFKVGDKVIPTDCKKWFDEAEYKEVTNCIRRNDYYVYRLSGSVCAWKDHELQLWKEPQTEFTFQELFTIEDRFGNTYETSHKYSNIKSVYFADGGGVSINFANKHTTLGISSNCKFKLQEPKKNVPTYKVEHQKGGKQYEFTSSQLLDEGQFVVCDTKHGKSYGRITEFKIKELTETEIKQYKECWRA